MKKYLGKGVYGAVAIGKISVFKKCDAAVTRIHVEDTEKEKQRVKAAKELAAKQLTEIHEKALREVGETHAQIFEIHLMMLDDDDYNESIENIIDTQSVNAEYAVALTSDNFAEMFSSMDDAYMQARAADVRDISNRIIANLTGANTDSTTADEKSIVCADDLAPSETVSLDKDKVLAFVTAHGSSNSHTAILARNMNIPAVIGVGDSFLSEIHEGETVIVDGFTGEIIVAPDEQTLKAYTEKQKRDEEQKKLLQELKGKENITLDGTKINVFANISGIDNIGAVLLNDAGGIGLFRSEFLYLENSDFPTEEQQFHAYKRVLAWAVEHGNTELVHYVMNCTTQEEYERFENTPLESACLCGNYGMLKFIAENEKSPYFSQDNSLFYAAAYGDRGIIRCLIENGYDVNMKDGYGGNALEWAAQENRISNAKMLIESGCDVNNLNGEGMTALYTACAEGNTDMARLLLNNNAEPDRTEDATPLIIASCYGKIDCAELLLEHGSDVNTIDNEGRTALFYAMVYGQDEIEKLRSFL
mgnify:CR=1 FL=1